MSNYTILRRDREYRGRYRNDERDRYNRDRYDTPS